MTPNLFAVAGIIRYYIDKNPLFAGDGSISYNGAWNLLGPLYESEANIWKPTGYGNN
jgi:hypothetical protein